MNNETIKVLLIDDSRGDYILTREMLSEIGSAKYQLDWAPSYKEGFKCSGAKGARDTR